MSHGKQQSEKSINERVFVPLHEEIRSISLPTEDGGRWMVSRARRIYCFKGDLFVFISLTLLFLSASFKVCLYLLVDNKIPPPVS